MWNDRYDVDEYVYGTEPNTFLVEHAAILNNPVLSLAEGEGRNGVFLATLGLNVHCVDGSEVGLKKAQALAKSKGVEIQTEVTELGDFSPKQNHYGGVISISAHLPSAIRARLYPLIEQSLKPGAIIILEAYSESQLTRSTGGPKDLDMLMTIAKIEHEFSNFEVVILRETERVISEGQYHSGQASVIQFVGRKRNLDNK